RAGVENQRASIARRQALQFLFALRRPKCFRRAHDLTQFLQILELLVDEQLRVTDDVNKQNVPDFELHIGGMLGQHGIFLSKESAFNEPIFDRRQAPAPLETLRRFSSAKKLPRFIIAGQRLFGEDSRSANRLAVDRKSDWL